MIELNAGAITGITMAATLGVYLGVVASLRYRRRNIIAALPPPTGDDLEIIHQITTATLTDFPFLYRTSLEFGFFKTYGIPTIAKLLVATGETVGSCTRRLIDTDLIIREFNEHPLTSERSHLAIRRLNHLHGKYPISNADFLYVLCVFIVEPVRWINRFGFRKLHTNEMLAHYLHWRQVGIYMGITQIPASIEAAAIHLEAYEAEKLIYTDASNKIAKATVEGFLKPFPSFLHGGGRQAVYALTPPNLRVAMGFPEAPHALTSVLLGTLSAMGCFVRYLMLPRSKLSARTGKVPNKDGSYCPAFAIYDKTTYKDGYFIHKLGPAKFAEDGLLGTLHQSQPDSIKTD
ncbi:hypothetical protein BSLG_002112 [Batrachochytrium salamandrivorans]|nr:hypothetical protein BASA83_003492 [Batrachochytrium salamandrivorans]KAJ1343086.1 hypothetical protein BSLG_002112 [Batrachochytrium salamandrivorans]